MKDIIIGKITIFFMMIGAIFIARPAFAQQSLGVFDGQTDVGNLKVPGAGSYDDETGEYTLEGAGYNIWHDHDAFHFVWKRMSGNFILRTQAKFLSKGGKPDRKLGWMIRSTLDADASYVDAAVHGRGLTSLQFRKTKGDSTLEKRAPINGADVIQLERKGNTYTMSVAHRGEPFDSSSTKTITLNLGDDVYVGLFVCSHQAGKTAKVAYNNVRMIKPAPDSLVPYRDYLGSNLEILNLKTENRRIIYRSPNSLQAPNWTPDGKTLIYNSQGLLYAFDLETKTPKELSTGSFDNLNNDHVLSFDGKQMGISHQPQGRNESVVSTLPVQGGEPREITPKGRGPSYLHGWSPDGKWLTYTARRNGTFNIYKIPAKGGQEIQLTKTKGLDDGPEYSPNGAYIYFCSERTGQMEIWRMKPDGSAPQQLTDDQLNNWFPHLSPDGKQIIFISFMPTVASGDHPFYKQVYLREMPVDGGEPTVVAYIYGGQGTINVPSWSPDGSRVAFISNTGM